MVSQRMHFSYFSRITERGKKFLLLWSNDREMTRMKLILSRGGGGFGATADRDSEPQQKAVRAQGQFWDTVEMSCWVRDQVGSRTGVRGGF